MNSINIDFQIYDSRDPKSFIVLDTSNWENLENKPSIIEVILPGESQPYTHYLSKNAVNIFNANNLGLSCNGCSNNFDTELPDGIYDITIKGSPDRFNKNRKYLRTTKTQLQLDNLYVKVASECFNSDSNTKAQVDRLNEIQFLLKASEANVRFGNNLTAQDLFFKAQKKIQKTNCKNCK